MIQSDIIRIYAQCPKCREGHGNFKLGKTQLYHLQTNPLGMSPCLAADLVKPYILSVNQTKTPVFTEEFIKAYDFLYEQFNTEVLSIRDFIIKYSESIKIPKTQEDFTELLENIAIFGFQTGINYKPFQIIK